MLRQAAAIDLREKVAMAISQVDDKLHLEDIAELDELEKIEKLYRETLHQCYSFGFEVGAAAPGLHSALYRGTDLSYPLTTPPFLCIA